MRGDSVISQPLEDQDSDSLLCWNGECWKIGDQIIRGNDAEIVFDKLIECTRSCSREQALQGMIGIIKTIAGPFAFVFYDAPHRRILYGRDALGRRSLVVRKGSDETFNLSSICDHAYSTQWTEVAANGIYIFDLQKALDSSPSTVSSLSHIAQGDSITTLGLPASILSATTTGPSPSEIPRQPMHLAADGEALSHLKHEVSRDHEHYQLIAFSNINSDHRNGASSALSLESPAVDRLLQELRSSLLLRLKDIPVPPSSTPNAARVAILFSGGLDCTVLARLAHEILPTDQEIDLLNVAFENPRVMKARSTNQPFKKHCAFSLCPDRNTGKSSYAELLRVCGPRTWRFVAIDVSYDEVLAHRSQIISLMYPHKTEMDFSIACALYFAARGNGTIQEADSHMILPHVTPARVLLSGLGADELFGGYTRHATTFNRRGYVGLISELQLDFDRIGQRNLGRDDRVISHWGKEVRYPYLDEDLVSWALGIPVWEKCGFGDNDQCEDNDYPVIEPGKKLLRLLSWKLGMQGAAVEKKTAIQFGARSAKMESGKTKGTAIVL